MDKSYEGTANLTVGQGYGLHAEKPLLMFRRTKVTQIIWILCAIAKEGSDPL